MRRLHEVLLNKSYSVLSPESAEDASLRDGLRKDPDTLEYLLNQVKEAGALGELEFGSEDPRLHSLAQCARNPRL
jgi:hypothetical protein